jgi:hypothetical protein
MCLEGGDGWLYFQSISFILSLLWLHIAVLIGCHSKSRTTALLWQWLPSPYALFKHVWTQLFSIGIAHWYHQAVKNKLNNATALHLLSQSDLIYTLVQRSSVFWTVRGSGALQGENRHLGSSTAADVMPERSSLPLHSRVSVRFPEVWFCL